MKKILLVAGEASGDLHGAHLVQAIRQIDPQVKFFGVGGDGLKKNGMEVLYSSHSLSVLGGTEILSKLWSIWKALKGLKESLDREKPDLAILIDFPDFNLRLAKMAHKRKIPVLYYISPQVWAWRSRRVKLIAQRVKKMVVFFPFEVPIYEAAGVDVTCVGHPLIDLVKPTLSREAAYEKFDLAPDRKTVGLLPGSRISEVARLLPPLLDAAQLLLQEMPGLQFILPLAPGISKPDVLLHMKPSTVAVRVVENSTYDVMNLSDLLITTSGTATLEGAILGKPMVILYKVSSLSYCIGRVLIHVDHIGLPNLVAEERIVPELIQKDANPRRIAQEAIRILENPILYQKMTSCMAEVRERLGKPGAAERAAMIALSLMNYTQV